jgi:NADH-quinone oxidoreductase subunit E/NADP-reducing hydrogenase subunit HndA
LYYHSQKFQKIDKNPAGSSKFLSNSLRRGICILIEREERRGTGIAMACCQDHQHYDRDALISFIEGYRGQPSGLIQVLSRIQQTVGYLPKDLLAVTSERLDLSLTEVYGTASFYAFFTFRPRGRHGITLCNGTACYVKGAGQVLESLEQELNIRAGDTTSDRKYSLDVVRCIGCCALAPVITIDEDVYAGVDPEKVPEILGKYE